uniref:DUF1415 domain-containing protein n=1 Tax=Chaetoceros debilis TaxID=122233 RepID=A0A7S3PVT2_9STRA|mmetsp:Transcript_22826/g.34820  ORF Transcript_22826/g.34820 Transcript_22826/m.34820 type:complete len:267 (-) Transcript_22826:246-1046(-)|eukprot:CAMPEP_0194122218 /NCGR_PEP_ID=MMETSP0150-20130528/49698_1 /TAXON_ID=122233 /ORGANISM="Chaetoceros debilis, Strain MM31A-1" /LENGTH=266 /DNA_ID=CAMNT_0038814961 /DNA_START=146 /DNA_END=946 /DNA_ORIENTATION=-
MIYRYTRSIRNNHSARKLCILIICAATARPPSIGATSFINHYVTTRRSLSRTSKIVKSPRNLSNSCVNIHECEDEIIRRTNKWVKNVIVGLNFCPFAERALTKNELQTIVVRGDNEEEIISSVLLESLLRKDQVGTTLVVTPDLHSTDFIDFWNVVDFAESTLRRQDLDGIIQIAPFHPLFEFAGEEDDVGNLTNRSPYPIFHILREDEVERAVEKLKGDSSKVWKRNISLLESMEEHYGRSSTESIMSGAKQVEGVLDLIKKKDD